MAQLSVMGLGPRPGIELERCQWVRDCDLNWDGCSARDINGIASSGAGSDKRLTVLPVDV